MQVRRRALVLLLGLALLAVPAHAAPRGTGFGYRSTCQGFGSFFPADAAAVRTVGAVPAKFALLGEQTGRASLLIASWTCEFAFGRHVVRGARYAHVSAVLSQPPAGTYDIWQLTSAPAFANPARRLGVPVETLQGLRVAFGSGVPVTAEASVPWRRSPYTMTASYTPTSPTLPFPELCRPEQPATDGRGCFPSDHYYAGRHGVAHAAHANCDLTTSAGVVTLRATPGSPLATLLGAAEVTQPGITLGFRGQVRHDLAARHPGGVTPRPACP